MSAILSLFSPLKWHSQGSHTDDDLIDRLNHSYTAILLTIFAIVVSTKQVGYPRSSSMVNGTHFKIPLREQTNFSLHSETC